MKLAPIASATVPGGLPAEPLGTEGRGSSLDPQGQVAEACGVGMETVPTHALLASTLFANTEQVAGASLALKQRPWADWHR